MHQTKKHTDAMPYGWDRLASYTIGIVGTYPFVMLFWQRLKGNKHRSSLAYLLGFLGVGVGVAAGYWLDTVDQE